MNLASKNPPVKEKKKLRNTVLRVLGVLVGVLLIIVLLRKTDLHSLLVQIRTLGWSFFGVIAVTFFAQLIAVYAWALSFQERMGWRAIPELFEIRLVGESLSQVNPTNIVAGETLKIILLKRVFGTDYRTGGLSILLSRIMILLASCFLIVVGAVAILQLFDAPALREISIVMCISVGVLFWYTFFMLRRGYGILSIFAKALGRIFGRVAWVKKGINYLIEVDADMVVFYKKKKAHFYAVFFLSLMHRVVGSLEYYVIFNALGIDIGMFTCILFDITSTLIRSCGFFIPGQVGLEEMGNKLMFTFVNVPGGETWLTVSLVRACASGVLDSRGLCPVSCHIPCERKIFSS